MGLIEYGRILKRHGLSGEVKFITFSGEYDNFNNLNSLFIKLPSEAESKEFSIQNWKSQKSALILKLADINTPEEADSLKGLTVYINTSDLKETDDDEYYWFELIGLNVYTDQNKFVGKVESLIDNTSQVLLVIKNEEKETLVPFIDQFVDEINIGKSKIIITPIEGLID